MSCMICGTASKQNPGRENIYILPSGVRQFCQPYNSKFFVVFCFYIVFVSIESINLIRNLQIYLCERRFL